MSERVTSVRGPARPGLRRSVFSLVAVAVVVAGCKKPAPLPPPIPISINVPREIRLSPGDSVPLAPMVSDQYAATMEVEVSIRSLNESVATFADGIVAAQGEGTTLIAVQAGTVLQAIDVHVVSALQLAAQVSDVTPTMRPEPNSCSYTATVWPVGGVAGQVAEIDSLYARTISADGQVKVDTLSFTKAFGVNRVRFNGDSLRSPRVSVHTPSPYRIELELWYTVGADQRSESVGADCGPHTESG